MKERDRDFLVSYLFGLLAIFAIGLAHHLLSQEFANRISSLVFWDRISIIVILAILNGFIALGLALLIQHHREKSLELRQNEKQTEWEFGVLHDEIDRLKNKNKPE